MAGSSVTGDGSWLLEGDYPGSANIAFSRLDFARLHAWIDSSKPAAAETSEGFAEGGLRIDGPALRPRDLKAELQIPKFEFGPVPGAIPLRTGAAPLVIRNAEPMAASMANSVFTVESAHLVGRDTDLTIGGKISSIGTMRSICG